MTRQLHTILISLALPLAACSSDDGESDTSGSDSGTAAEEATAADDDGDTSADAADAADAAEDSTSSADGDGTSTLTTTGEESTGDGGTTGGNACPPDGTEGECLLCLQVNCCDALMFCLEDADCACMVSCLDDGGGATGTGTGGGGCLGMCNDGGAMWTGFNYCLGGSCSTQCGG